MSETEPPFDSRGCDERHREDQGGSLPISAEDGAVPITRIDPPNDSVLHQAAWLQQQMKDSPDIHIMLTGAMTRLGVSGIGELASQHPEDFELLHDAARVMLDEIPEDQLHRIDAGKPPK